MAQRKSPSGGEKYAGMIREARAAAGLNQQRLAEMLGVSRNTVAGWETGHSRPDLDCLPALCRALGISLNHFFGVREGATQAERRLVKHFRSLEASDQQALIWQVEALAAGRASQREAADQQARMEALRGQVVNLYRSELSAAAGFGATLEAERGEVIWLRRDPLTERADEVIPVNGRSMEPSFFDGDEVLVQHAEALREGEIGVFLVDGEGYIKEYHADGLHSHNPAYPVMRFSEGNDVRCVGRVLGRVEDSQRLTKEETTWMEESK